MIWTMGITALCTIGISFYLRFLVALWKECRPVSSGYWMLVRIHDQPPPPQSISLVESRCKPVSRAA